MGEGQHVVLCIDDDPDILASLRVVLEASGYGVVTAATGPDAIRAFEAATPDVVLVDLMMEQVDTGLKLVPQIKALDPSIPIYVLSSTGDYLHGTMDVNALGVSGVFQKPLEPSVLLSLIGQKLAAPVH